MDNSGKNPYTRLETADGSPTLKLSSEGEPMHSLEGAFTETQYIYQPIVEKAFESVENPVILSVGLGLGYNEILAVCESIKQGKLPSLIQSYEAVPELRTAFEDWICNEADSNTIYDDILQRYAEHYSLPASAILFRLRDLLSANKLILDGAIEATTVPPRANAICFDAFSNKTNPELWNEEFLTQFFKNASSEKCYVSTYACTGTLKRALKTNGFLVELKKGFGTKRESTAATKNL